MGYLGPCWNMEIQLRLTDLRIHDEGSNVHENAGAAFLDLHEFLGLEIMQDDTHLLHRHFGIFGHKTERVESGGLKQVNLIVPGQCLRISLPEGEGLREDACSLQVNHFERVQEGIVGFDSLFVEAHCQFFFPCSVRKYVEERLPFKPEFSL